jgi:hypothetical protein
LKPLVELRKMYEGISIGGPVHFPSRTFAQYDLAALFSVLDIDLTIMDALASVDKSMYPSVASRELTTIESDYAMEFSLYR